MLKPTLLTELCSFFLPPSVAPLKGHEVETEVRQARNQKAAAIELKKEGKSPDKVESAYFETEEYKVSCNF